MKKFEKEGLHAECQLLWDQFDPIGLSECATGIDDEYRSYIPHTAELVLASADRYKFSKFIKNCLYVDMGLSRSPSSEEAIAQFVEKLCNLAELAHTDMH
ncbi:hypothetical protein [Halovulum sp. GXIMD14793]